MIMIIRNDLTTLLVLTALKSKRFTSTEMYPSQDDANQKQTTSSMSGEKLRRIGRVFR